MKKSKMFFGMILVGLTTLSTFIPQKTNANPPVDYVWATLRVVAGIAVCDGAADNCTKPKT